MTPSLYGNGVPHGNHMENKKIKILHKRSKIVANGNPKLPSASGMDYGEIAINYHDGSEVISIKNDNDQIKEFRTKDYFDDRIDNQSQTLGQLVSEIVNINNRIDENEEVGAAALTDFDTRFNDINDLMTEFLDRIESLENKIKNLETPNE